MIFIHRSITIDEAISKLRSVFIQISDSLMKKIKFANKCRKNKCKKELNEWFDVAYAPSFYITWVGPSRAIESVSTGQGR